MASYPFPGVLIVECSAQREVMSGGKRAKERKSPPRGEFIFFTPGTEEVFSRVPRELRFVGRRPTRVRLKAEDTSVKAARKPGASGTQGNILRRSEISYS